jgi:hypothetical protein
MPRVFSRSIWENATWPLACRNYALVETVHGKESPQTAGLGHLWSDSVNAGGWWARTADGANIDRAPLILKLELRAITVRPAIFDKSVIMSSLILSRIRAEEDKLMSANAGLLPERVEKAAQDRVRPLRNRECDRFIGVQRNAD